MSQTVYNTLPHRAVAGMLADLNPKRVSTFNNPTDAMVMGQFAARVTSDDNGCKKPAASGDVILGVVMRDLVAVPAAGATLDLLAAKSAVPILHEGEIWVKTEEAIAVGDTPYIVYAGKKQVQTITLGSDLGASNVITTVVNGSSVSYTYASTHDASMTAHAAQIAALAGVDACTSTGRVITVTSEIDTPLTITSSVAGGSAVTITVAQTVAALTTANFGMLRNDADTSRALDASAYVKILEYDSVTTLARVMVRVLA
jgi:hypothetical protein